MLLFHGIGKPYAAQDFRREIRDAGEDDITAFAQRVAHAQHTVIGNTDNIAGPGFVDRLPLLREEQDGIVDADALLRAGLLQLHAATETAGAQPQKGDAVAVVRVHVGLHFEHKAGDLAFRGFHALVFRSLCRPTWT